MSSKIKWDTRSLCHAAGVSFDLIDRLSLAAYVQEFLMSNLRLLSFFFRPKDTDIRRKDGRNLHICELLRIRSSKKKCLSFIFIGLLWRHFHKFQKVPRRVKQMVAELGKDELYCECVCVFFALCELEGEIFERYCWFVPAACTRRHPWHLCAKTTSHINFVYHSPSRGHR